MLPAMGMKANIEHEDQAVCGQAHAIFDILVRSGSLPTHLSLSIEEILERAWEIAYHKPERRMRDNVVSLAQVSAHRAAARAVRSTLRG